MAPFRKSAVLVGVFSLAVSLSPLAHAGWVQLDQVDGVVTPLNGRYDYAFTVYNNSYLDVGEGPNDVGGNLVPVIVDFELPYFADMAISDVLSPAGWSYEIARIGQPNAATGWSGVADWMTDPAWVNSPFAGATEVIHWYCNRGVDNVPLEVPGAMCWNAIRPQTEVPSLEGFGFTSDYSPTDAPYQTSWDYIVPRLVGDPPMPVVPGSPCALGQCGNNVPEPGSFALVGAALLAAWGGRRRKRD